MSSSGYKGTDGRTYYYDDKTKNVTIKDSSGKTVYSDSGSSSNKTSNNTTSKSTGSNKSNSIDWGSFFANSDPHNHYNALQSQLGRKPTASDISEYTQQYKSYLSGRTNPNSGVVWNQYGEIIGNTGTGKGGYTDFSWQASNATVDPNRVWDDEARKNSAYQRYLTSTSLNGKYLNYDTGSWEYAPSDVRNNLFSGFLNYDKIPEYAEKWLKDNPGSTWDVDSLSEFWKNKYVDIKKIASYIDKYSHEFGDNKPGQVYFDEKGNAQTGKKQITSQTIPNQGENKGVAQSGVAPINTAIPAFGGKYATTVTLPDGTTVGANIINGVTFLPDGSRPPIGSYIQTQDGVYQMTENGGVKVNTTPGANNVAQPQIQNNQGMQEIERFLKQSSEDYYNMQKAEIEASAKRAIMELEKAYADAIAEGRISEREAINQFNAQKAEIERQAYLDSQYTNLYAQDKGIQNSQQMIGLMQSDSARKSDLLNQNATERDMRINNIRDRINAITQQKNLGIANINYEADSAMIKARGEANMLYNQGMLGLMREDYSANRDHQYALDLLQKQSQLRISEMLQGHELSKEIIDIEFNNQLAMMAQQFGYSSALQSASAQQQLMLAKQKAELEAEKAEKDYQRQLQQIINSTKPGTLEYEARIATLNNERTKAISTIINNSVAQGLTTALIEGNQNVLFGGFVPPTEPKYGAGTTYFDIYKYNKQMEEYNRQLEIVNKTKSILNNPDKLFEGW